MEKREQNKNEELAFISYLDENNNKVEGYFKILSVNGFILIFETTGGNKITLPYSRVLKIKERLNG